MCINIDCLSVLPALPQWAEGHCDHFPYCQSRDNRRNHWHRHRLDRLCMAYSHEMPACVQTCRFFKGLSILFSKSKLAWELLEEWRPCCPTSCHSSMTGTSHSMHSRRFQGVGTGHRPSRCSLQCPHFCCRCYFCWQIFLRSCWDSNLATSSEACPLWFRPVHHSTSLQESRADKLLMQFPKWEAATKRSSCHMM